jgi:hypothetical protein
VLETKEVKMSYALRIRSSGRRRQVDQQFGVAKSTAENKSRNIILKGVNDGVIALEITQFLGFVHRLLGEHDFSEVGAVTETLRLFFQNNRS